MSKQLWLEARDRFIEQFIEEFDREPTDEELEKGMEGAYADYVSTIMDIGKNIRKYGK